MIDTMQTTDGLFVKVVLLPSSYLAHDTDRKIYWLFLASEIQKNDKEPRSFKGPFKDSREAYSWVASNNSDPLKIKYVIVNESEL